MLNPLLPPRKRRKYIFAPITKGEIKKQENQLHKATDWGDRNRMLTLRVWRDLSTIGSEIAQCPWREREAISAKLGREAGSWASHKTPMVRSCGLPQGFWKISFLPRVTSRATMLSCFVGQKWIHWYICHCFNLVSIMERTWPLGLTHCVNL